MNKGKLVCLFEWNYKKVKVCERLKYLRVPFVVGCASGIINKSLHMEAFGIVYYILYII